MKIEGFSTNKQTNKTKLKKLTSKSLFCIQYVERFIWRHFGHVGEPSADCRVFCWPESVKILEILGDRKIMIFVSISSSSREDAPAVMLWYQINPVGVELFLNANIFFCPVNSYGCWSREGKRSIMFVS